MDKRCFRTTRLSSRSKTDISILNRLTREGRVLFSSSRIQGVAAGCLWRTSRRWTGKEWLGKPGPTRRRLSASMRTTNRCNRAETAPRFPIPIWANIFEELSKRNIIETPWKTYSFQSIRSFLLVGVLFLRMMWQNRVFAWPLTSFWSSMSWIKLPHLVTMSSSVLAI